MICKFGAKTHAGEVAFGLWAPSAKRVEIKIGGHAYEMPDVGNGWREFRAPAQGHAVRYSYVIDGQHEVPDPASAFQPEGVFGPSQVIDHDAYLWNDHEWKGRPWAEAVIWEAHVGTGTPQGTFRALIDKLPHLKSAGITAIELMPVAEFAGTRNWGYDGVLPFAPTHNYGTPDDLKDLVTAAHKHELMVLLDVVFNHFGPSGNYLHSYAERFFTSRHQTPWGAGINFDGEGNDYVRNFFLQCALSWIRDYHLDGLRFDAVHAMLDDSAEHILESLASEIRKMEFGRPIHLVLENEHNQSHWLEREQDHSTSAFTAQWNDDFHHCWHVLMTGEEEGYYANFHPDAYEMLQTTLKEGFVFQGQETINGHKRGSRSAHLTPAAFVSFLQNHDQIGNRAYGERLTTLADGHQLDIARAVLLLSPQVPMMFMGDEWGSKTPFMFFVDFEDQDLSNAVRDGRRREFSAFKAFSSEAAVEAIPDPTSRMTFERSKLVWSDLDQPECQKVLAKTRQLLRLRADHVAPLLSGGFLGADGDINRIHSVTWRFKSAALNLHLNVSTETVREPLSSNARLIYQSDRCAREADVAILEPWSCMFTTEAS